MDELQARQPHHETQARQHRRAMTVRDEELTQLKSFVADPHEGVLLLLGEVGSGKSRLLDSLEHTYPEISHVVRANTSERTVPLSGLSAILAAFQESEAIAMSARLITPTQVKPASPTLALELLSFFRSTSRSPALLLVDDLDLMDELSQSIVAMVANRLGSSRLRLIGAVTSMEAGPLSSLPRLKLAPLGFSDAMRLLSSVGQPPINEAVRQLLVEASHGNPSSLVHNSRALTAEQLSGDAPIGIPFRMSRSATETAPNDPPLATRRVILAQLSCARLTSEDTLTQSSEIATDQLDDLITEGVVVRDQGFLRLSDPLLRSRLYWSLGAASRNDYHAAAARAEAPREPSLASWHRSWLHPTRVTAEELLPEATRFVRRGFPFQAIELAERALSLGTVTTRLSLELARLAEAMLLRGEVTHAARYIRLAQRQPGAESYRTRLVLLRSWIEFMSSQQLISANSGVWLSTHGPVDPRRAIGALATFAVFHTERWELGAARDAVAHARQLHERLPGGTTELLDAAEMVIAALEGDPSATTRMFDRTPTRTMATSPTQLLLLGRALTFSGRHNDARQVLQAIIDTEPSPPLLWATSAKYAMAENEILAGNQFEAVASIDRLHTGPADAHLHQNVYLLLRAWYWLAQNNQEEATEAIADCHRSFAAGDNPALTARLEAYQGSFALAHSHLDEAIAFLRGAVSFASPFGLPSLLRHRVDLIEAYVLAGRQADALAQFQELRARSTPYRTQAGALEMARAHALVTHGEPSIGAFHQAVKLWRPGDPQFELGRLLLSFGDRLAQLGNLPESKEQYLASRIIFTQLGATSWAKKAETSNPVQASGNDHPLMSSLNWDEQAVANLVCRGRRNKEIAQELFVSLRTVEVRLTKIYHKLNVRSRTHLISLLSNLDPTPRAEAADRY